MEASDIQHTVANWSITKSSSLLFVYACAKNSAISSTCGLKGCCWKVNMLAEVGLTLNNLTGWAFIPGDLKWGLAKLIPRWPYERNAADRSDKGYLNAWLGKKEQDTVCGDPKFADPNLHHISTSMNTIGWKYCSRVPLAELHPKFQQNDAHLLEHQSYMIQWGFLLRKCVQYCNLPVQPSASLDIDIATDVCLRACAQYCVYTEWVCTCMWA